MTWLLSLHALATLVMTGVIWCVQVVHYPLFARVGAATFAAYGREHTRRIGPLVAPLMLLEAGTAVAIVVVADAGPLALGGLLLLVVIWASTALLQVPCHRRLACEFDPAAARRLTATNWVRTAAWTLRAVIALLLLVHAG